METKDLTTTDYNLEQPAKLVGMADTLKNFIHQQKLSVQIQGKPYANVEAWQFAGMSLGIIPVCTHISDLSKGDEIKYSAIVELRRLSGEVVGQGFAICSNKERTKRCFEEYAICSMAQTRAVGKAYRNMLAWLMKAAGYEPTPAEEMEGVEIKENSKQFEKSEVKKAETIADNTRNAKHKLSPIGFQKLLDRIRQEDYTALTRIQETNELTEEQIKIAKKTIEDTMAKNQGNEIPFEQPFNKENNE